MKKLLLISLFVLSSGSISAWPNLQDFQPSDETRSFLNKAAGATALGAAAGIVASHAAPYVWFLSNGIGGSLGLEMYLNHHNFVKAGALVGAGLGLKSLASNGKFIKKNLPYAGIALAPLLLSNLENLNNSPITPSFGSLRIQIVAGLAAASYANYLNSLDDQNNLENNPIQPGRKNLLRATQIGGVYLGAATMHYLFVKSVATIWNAFNS